MDAFKAAQNKHLGPGGYKCPCCGPVSLNNKKKMNRAARRELKKQLRLFSE